MIDDKKLDRLLSDYKPHVREDGDFMKQLTRCMDAVDLVMEYKAREMRLYRQRATVAFVVGVMMGVLFTFIAVLLPSPVELLGLTVQSPLLWFLLDNLHYTVLVLCSFLLLYGFIGLVRTHECEYMREITKNETVCTIRV